MKLQFLDSLPVDFLLNSCIWRILNSLPEWQLCQVDRSFVQKLLDTRVFSSFDQRDDRHITFLFFPLGFEIPIIFYSLNSNCSAVLDLRNLQAQVKKQGCTKQRKVAQSSAK